MNSVKHMALGRSKSLADFVTTFRRRDFCFLECILPSMRRLAPFLLLALCYTLAVSQTAPASRQGTYETDFEHYWQIVYDDFAYFDDLTSTQQRPRSDWKKVRIIFTPLAAKVTDREQFVRLLERANNELFNGHITLNTNLRSSNRIIPSGSDLWAVPKGQQFVITDVREASAAQVSGLRPGMILRRFNGAPIAVAVKQFLPRSRTTYSTAVYEYAVNMLLAGTHDTPRTIEVEAQGAVKTFTPEDSLNDPPPRNADAPTPPLLSARTLPSGIAYVRIHNSLGDNALITVFDAALDSLMESPGLILDLRDTPSGGNTTVARGILGRFIAREMPYQRIAYPQELRAYGVPRHQLDLVTRRGKQYRNPVVLLVGRWTGSVGEGLTIGFAATRRAEVVGTKMAGLLGAMCSYQLPWSKIGFSIPCEQTLQVNGTPREDFLPAHIVAEDAAANVRAVALAEHLIGSASKSHRRSK